MADETLSPYSYDDSYNSRPELSAKPVDKRPMLIGGAVAIGLIVILVGLGIILFFNPAAAAVLRDIFIIYMAIGSFVIILLLIILAVITAYLVLKVNDLIQLLDREIKPALGKMQGTLNTVRGTTSFISEQAVQPVIATASSVSAVRAIFRSLFQRN